MPPLTKYFYIVTHRACHFRTHLNKMVQKQSQYVRYLKLNGYFATQLQEYK
jgi:hypothetical protein